MNNPHDHFWIVGSDVNRYWSSAVAGYVTQLPPLAFLTMADAEAALGMPTKDLEKYVTIVSEIGSENELAALLAEYGLPGPVVIVPKSVTLYQGRAALINAGLFDQVKAAVDAGGQNSLAFQAFEYANHWYRDSAFIAQLAGGLGLTEQQIDDLFISAGSL